MNTEHIFDSALNIQNWNWIRRWADLIQYVFRNIILGTFGWDFKHIVHDLNTLVGLLKSKMRQSGCEAPNNNATLNAVQKEAANEKMIV